MAYFAIITHVLRYYPTSCVAASPLNVDYISVDLVATLVVLLCIAITPVLDDFTRFFLSASQN